jgi:hypothetical protein
MNARERDARVEAEIAAPLRAVNSTLDELHRARLESAIEAMVRREAVAAIAGGGGRRWRFWISTAGVVAAVVAAVIVFRGPRTPTPTTPRAALRAPAQSAPALLAPYRAAGEGATALAPSTSLLALAGERVRATIGSRVRLTLVGPGRVAVVSSARADDVELALEGGRLLVDYDGHAGGRLRVHSPGAVTTVVGTLFAVEAGPSGSRVAVARGHVRTEDGAGRVWQVAAGDSWTGAEGRLSPTDPLPAHRDLPLAQAAARPSAPPARVRSNVDLEALYIKAESAMRARAVAKARRALETIADRDRRGPLGEAALLDLARLALAEGDREEARRALARLPGKLADPALAETAEHLRCRVERSGDSGEPCGP